MRSPQNRQPSLRPVRKGARGQFRCKEKRAIRIFPFDQADVATTSHQSGSVSSRNNPALQWHRLGPLRLVPTSEFRPPVTGTGQRNHVTIEPFKYAFVPSGSYFRGNFYLVRWFDGGLGTAVQ